MKVDKLRAIFITLLFPAAVALSLLMPSDVKKNLTLIAICAVYALLTSLLLKKRSIFSHERTLVAVVVTVACVLLVAFCFLTGIKFGFSKNPFTHIYIYKYILPFTAIVILSEQMRSVMLSQKSKLILIYSIFAFSFLDCMMQISRGTFEGFQTFVSFIGLTAFPAISTNLACTFLSRKYGAIPNISLRLIPLLWRYLFPILPKSPEILSGLLRFVFPLAVAALVHFLFGNKHHKSHRKKPWVENLVFVTLCGVALSLAMLISCQYKYCFLVIASPSMTGTLDKGDGIIYRSYDGEWIEEGEIIVFQKGEIQVIHRVIDIQYVDGEFRYFTGGDANETDDPWYVTVSDIEGIVISRIRYVGIPTLALRSLFV